MLFRYNEYPQKTLNRNNTLSSYVEILNIISIFAPIFRINQIQNVMEIQDLYISSTRLVRGTDCRFKRYLYYAIDWDVRMLCIRGAKGVGKTTLMLQYIKEHFSKSSEALYASLDDLWFVEHRLIDLVEYHYTHGGTHLFLDEVHRYPFQTWSTELKNARDKYPSLHIVFSGSSLLQLNQSSADLSRRCIFYDIQGLSFREYLMLEKGISIPVLTLPQLLEEHETHAADIASTIKILPLFSDYLHHGYYPFYRESRRSYAKAIQQIVTEIIDTDMPAIKRIEYITSVKLKRLFVLISQMVPFTLNLTSLGQQIEAPRQTVMKMCLLLQEAALLNLLYSEKNNLNQLSKPEKLYLENTNLLYSMANNAEIGTIRETFFVNQLKESYDVAYTDHGDFKIDKRHVFEVGGKNKNFDQIKDVPDSFLAVDDTEIGHGNRIPLWMFGLLY